MMRHSFVPRELASSLVLFFSLHILLQPLSADQWTRFRGPNGQGISQAESIPAEFTEADYNWKTQLPGIGHSSPVVWSTKIFLLSADQKNATRFVLCYDAATGNRVWQKKYESTTHHLHTRSSYASCTPAVDADHVYVAWSTPESTTLKALKHDGQEVWSRDLGRWVSQHGFGTSPMLYKDLVILHNSQQEEQLRGDAKPGESFVMAFNRTTGEEVWRTPRVSRRVCYSVPCIQTNAAGEDELLCCNTGNGIFSLNPETGKLLWEVPDCFTMRCVASPVVSSGLVFGSTGSGGGGNYVVAVKPGEGIKYKIESSANYVPTPVALGGYIFLWYDKGIVSCVHAESGEVQWRKRVGGEYSGSPVIVGDKIYCIAEDGEVVVLAASNEYKLISRNPLGEDSRATPAISGGRMYLRTNSQLISIGGKSS